MLLIIRFNPHTGKWLNASLMNALSSLVGFSFSISLFACYQVDSCEPFSVLAMATAF